MATVTRYSSLASYRVSPTLFEGSVRSEEMFVFFHDSARPHVAKLSRQKIAELGWEVLPHPPYLPDLAPSDYHIFLDLRHHLRDRKFDNRSELETEISSFFESRPPQFWASGIKKLVDRWTYVVDHSGDYITN